MHPGTAAVMPRTSGALLLSPDEANVAEFRRQRLARDEERASQTTFRRRPLGDGEQASRVTRPSRRQIAQGAGGCGGHILAAETR
jgi:hypothetical protein